MSANSQPAELLDAQTRVLAQAGQLGRATWDGEEVVVSLPAT
jgi:hypothetical protein